MRRLAPPILILLTVAGLAAPAGAVESPSAPKKAQQAIAYVIPVRDEIARPVFYMLRRGLKDAIERKADVVVLDMETPGGALDVTFDIMEALAKFPGNTITYVNKEAISAGAFISAATGEIYFAPDGRIGAAAPVLATGGEIDETMKLKIVSYLKVRVRAISEGKGYRGQVISAMIDKDYELKIGDKVIKAKGELLSLTASEANATYGDPPQPLLAAGVAKDVDDLLAKKFGVNGYAMVKFRVTWSEELAVWLNAITPILLGLGLLALFIEFKTPGFGWIGITGIALLAVVFFGQYVAGFSGHEPLLLFALGVLLLGVELLFMPGMVLPALTGVACILASLVWAMADLWPNEPVTFSGDVFVRPLVNLGVGVALASVLLFIFAQYLPKTSLWHRLSVQGAGKTAAQVGGAAPSLAAALPSMVGQRGVAATGLFPSGEVEIDGQRYQARLELGFAQPGTSVVVTGQTDFGLRVERAET